MEKLTRKEQAKRTRAKLLESAINLLSIHSFDEINITDICTQAGVSVGAFYHHFQNKSEIIMELYKDVDDEFLNTVTKKCMALPPLDGIKTYLVEQCMCAVRYGIDTIKSVYKAQVDNSNDFFASNDRGLPDGLRTLLIQAKQENILAEHTDIEELLNQLLILSRGVIYYWCIRNGEIDMASYISTISDNYLKAFLA